MEEDGELEHGRDELRGRKLEHDKEDIRGAAPSLQAMRCSSSIHE
jgi:hypothetical protein